VRQVHVQLVPAGQAKRAHGHRGEELSVGGGGVGVGVGAGVQAKGLVVERVDKGPAGEVVEMGVGDIHFGES
jgi:hypothetical protein